NRPGSAADLRDQRQANLELLAAKMPIDLRISASGQTQLFSRDTTGADVLLVDGLHVAGPINFTGATLTGGAAAATLALSSGALQGSLTARDSGVQAIRSSLDQLSAQLVTAVNSAYNPTGLTGNFFQPTGTTAATLAVASGVTAATLKASDGGAAGIGLHPRTITGCGGLCITTNSHTCEVTTLCQPPSPCTEPAKNHYCAVIHGFLPAPSTRCMANCTAVTLSK
ncbi:MAG: hypothetical protein EBT62_10205, partial [Opitutaceae bacterium]|nr:hypothetical protein [Opitutaceae bacterium]